MTFWIECWDSEVIEMESIIMDSEIPLAYMKYDHVALGDLLDYVERYKGDGCHTDPQGRLKLIVRYSLGVMTKSPHRKYPK
jgi:hypothetical protein